MRNCSRMNFMHSSEGGNDAKRHGITRKPISSRG
nr:MAG TPA: hypothetical protein [Caudoviricetes sp.]